ncbi:hypothetical protein GOV13_03340 [Candidatus Pacearchaeota archaeon]|nr:hypothetical protein [Candidatus Pacearchaeota archaeon]
MVNETDLMYLLPQEFMNSASGLITLLKAVGIMVILYLIFSVINTVINRKKGKELKEINKNLIEIKKLLAKKK